MIYNDILKSKSPKQKTKIKQKTSDVKWTLFIWTTWLSVILVLQEPETEECQTGVQDRQFRYMWDTVSKSTSNIWGYDLLHRPWIQSPVITKSINQSVYQSISFVQWGKKEFRLGFPSTYSHLSLSLKSLPLTLGT